MKLKLKAQEKLYANGTFQTKATDGGSDGNGTFEFIASGMKVDRHNESVDPNGMDIKTYKSTNPVMLWGHNHNVPAIAKVTKIWKDAEQIYAKAEWAPTPFAQEIRQLVEGGFINAVSVGFIAREYEGEYPNYKYTKSELLEISVVNVPAYRDALISTAKSMGLDNVTKTLEEGTEAEEETPTETPTEPEVVAIEAAEKGIVLHMSDHSRKFIPMSEDADVKSMLEALAKKEGNVLLFTQEELKEFKKELEEPIPSHLKAKLSELGKSLEEVSVELKAIEAMSETTSETSETTDEQTQEEKEADSEKKLLRVADKAIEAILLKQRNKLSKKNK